MRYQVVARACQPSVGRWEYYPYLSPDRDKASAQRLARYAARHGYEAAILQGVTLEMLAQTARAAVEQQDERFIPLLRYMPGDTAARRGTLRDHDVGAGKPMHLTPAPDAAAPDKAALDALRYAIETGPGGDVGASTIWPLLLPSRMDVLRRWLRLRERVVSGQIGGEADGAQDVDAGNDH